MKKSRFTEEQIIGFIRQAEAGMPVKELTADALFIVVNFIKALFRRHGLAIVE